MIRNRPFLLAAALATACLTMPAFAADNAAADQKAKAALESIKSDPSTAPDKLFAFQAATGNLFEVKYAELVASKAQDAKVKELATMIMKDHQQANEQLLPITQKLGLDLPTDLPSDKQEMLDVLATLPADQLEMAYLMDMKADHLKDLTSYMDHQAAVKDADLRGYIGATLPKLKQHTQHVLSLAAEKGMGQTPMGNGGRAGGGMGGMDHGNGVGRNTQDATGPEPTPANH